MDDPARSPSARRALLALVVIFGLLTAGAILQRDRTHEQVYDEAQADAGLYAKIMRNSLTAGDLEALTEARQSVLLHEIQDDVLSQDDAIARVRLWLPDGTLLFSTDPADTPGAVVTDVGIDAALAAGTGSRLVVDRVSPTTSEADPRETPLFETFAPVVLRGATQPGAVAEIDQLASVLESRGDEPWMVVQLGAAALTAVLALAAFVSLLRSARKRKRSSRRDRAPSQVGADVGDGRRLEQAVKRAADAEAAAAAYSSQLDEATARLRAIERGSVDERIAELREALRRSEAERALLRAGRPETTVEVEVRELRDALREARSRAKAAEAVVARKGNASPVQEQLAASEREREDALERAKQAEDRAGAAEEEVRLTAELATSAEQRIDALQAKLEQVAAAASGSANGADVARLNEELRTARERAHELEQRAAEAEASVQASVGVIDTDVLDALEERVDAAEARAAEAEERIRAFEGNGDDPSSFRQTLGRRAAERKLAAPAPGEPEPTIAGPDVDLRTAIARSLRGPLTRAAGLTLSLHGAVSSSEGKTIVRQLSSALRRLDQLTADLHDVRRIVDGTLPLNRRRTDVDALLTTTLEESEQLQEDRLVRLEAQHVSAFVDPVRVRQIVEGMLEAARERTRAGAAIVVRARSTDAGVVIIVADDNQTPASIGPELSLAVRLAELHGSELVAEGSSYRLVLPADAG